MQRGFKAKNRKFKTRRQRLAYLHSSSGKAWILNPINSEREEWSECVRGNEETIEECDSKDQIPDESNDEFDDIESGFKR